MKFLQIQQCDLYKYCSHQKKHYDLWVYCDKNTLKVYQQQKPNTQHIWFQFYSFSNIYWKLMQSKCVQQYNGNFFYNFTKIKYFMLDYLLCDTNLSIKIDRNNNGVLTEYSREKIWNIHPRILRSLFNKIDIFPDKMTKKQQKQFQQQCNVLFAQGKSVTNPNKWIVVYCDLIAFWDKFGLNYFDLLKLPRETYMMLKKIMNFDNECKSNSMKSSSMNKNKGGVKF